VEFVERGILSVSLSDKFSKIFKIVWEAADSPARNWRKIFKALMLTEYLVKNGCERCVDEIRDHSYRIRQLQDFNYYEERVVSFAFLEDSY